MATVDIDLNTLESTLDKTEGIVVLDFWAPWCGPCRAFGPVYEKVSNAYPDAVFGKVNTQQHQDIAGLFRIQAIPTLMIFRGGIPVFRQAGMVPEAALRDLIEQVKKLDMDDVRSKFEKAQGDAKEQAESSPPLAH